MANDQLPVELLWLLDAPMFIDEKQVDAFYDAVVRPDYEGTSLTLSDTVTRNTTFGGGVTIGACGVRKFDQVRENRRFAGRTDFTHPTRPSRVDGYVHRRATSRRCQPSNVSGRTEKHPHAARGNSRLTAARNARSAHVSRGRDDWR